MLKAIFFATFDVNEGATPCCPFHSLDLVQLTYCSGPKVLHQVPTSSITASPSTPSIPLLHYPSISNLIIPHPTICNTGLLQLTTSHHRILSYPQHIASPSYPRNAYTFNFCLVLAEDVDFSSYVPVVRKLNTLFRTLEEQSQILSKDGSEPDTGKIYALCEILLEDLNNYSEAMIPIDSSNTLNIKLFPTYPPPPPLYAHHVPLSTVRLERLVDENWDLTMLRVLPWIDGINSVKQIAFLADADFKLVKKAIRHLLYYGCVLLLDVFSFSAIYAPTAEIHEFVETREMQEECAKYVALPDNDLSEGGTGFQRHLDEDERDKEPISGTELVELYLSIKQGQSVKSWCIEHADIAVKMDLRRFITFGVIKGFLYRVHKYAFAKANTKLTSSKLLTKANLELSDRKGRSIADLGDEQTQDAELMKYLDGTHSFDEICTELMISERELTSRLKALGDIEIICR